MFSGLNAKRWTSLFAAVWLLAACSSPAPLPSAPAVVPPPTRPQLSEELKTQPKPSGSYWSAVMQWRKDWAETLKRLQPKSEP